MKSDIKSKRKIYFQRALKFLLLMTVILVIVATVAFLINYHLKKSALQFLYKTFSSFFNPSNTLKEIGQFIINGGIIIPLQMFILSLIPIPFLYILNLIYTAYIPGVILGIAIRQFSEIPIRPILIYLPFIIIEFFAFSFLAATLYNLNKNIRKKIHHFFSKDKKQIFILNSFKDTLKAYSFVTLPLIIISAILFRYLSSFLNLIENL